MDYETASAIAVGLIGVFLIPVPIMLLLNFFYRVIVK